MSITIGLADDHRLLRNSLAEMLSNKGFKVIFEASNGKECVNFLKAGIIPDIILMDITMPVMDGCEATAKIKEDHPNVKILAVTMHDNEDIIIKMLKAGARGYILKNGNSKELVTAINTLYTKGYYTNDLVTSNLLNSIQKKDSDTVVDGNIKLTEREKEFMCFCCSENSYKEIASLMNVSQRTVDGYREDLFKKLNIHSRVGLVLFTIKNELIKL